MIDLLWFLTNFYFLSMKMVLKIKGAQKIRGEFNLLLVLVALTDKSSMPYFLYEYTMAASQSARATSPTSVRQFQTDVGNRQQGQRLSQAHKK